MYLSLQLVATKLNRDDLHLYLNLFPSLPTSDVWREKFIANYGSSLRKGTNYQLAYEVVEGSDKSLLKFAIKERRNDLVKYLWSRRGNGHVKLSDASMYGNLEIVEFLLERSGYTCR
jgi:hypothetical protein